MKKVKLSTTLGLIVLTAVTTVNITLLFSYSLLGNKQNSYQSMQSELSKIYEVMEMVDKYYIGDIDYEGAIDGASAGYIAGMGDRWSYYLTKEQYIEHQSSADVNLVGIGVNVVYDYNKDAILVTNVYKNSPASNSNVQKLDYIIAVDGQLVSEIGYQEAVDLVRGEAGSIVELEVVRNELPRIIEVERSTVAKVSVNYEMLDDDIAYIQISEFETDTANQFKEAIKNAQMNNATGVIFDLRNNPGGYLTKLVECLDIILPEGDVISTIDKFGRETVYTSDAEALEMEITVLVNSDSYSAAEFFAAAIQEYEVGTVIGEKTSGKGYSQTPLELSDGSAIILSMSKYYTPKGNSLAQTGVTPDIEVDLELEQVLDYYFLTPETDLQIQSAINQLTKGEDLE